MVAPYVVNGTKLVALPPSAIVAAARADIERHSHNAGAHVADIKPYAFHRRHVKKAFKELFVWPADIIKIALDDLEAGRESGKRQTRFLYESEEALRAALEEANASTSEYV